MRIYVIISLLILSFSACQNKMVDQDFEKDFEFAIQAVDNYYKSYFCFTRCFDECNDSKYCVEKYYDEKYHDGYYEVFYDHILAKIYFSLSYLEKLTGVDANITLSDPRPVYSSRKECLADIKKWEKWYAKNKYDITKEQSDSIKKLVWNAYIWWYPNEPSEMNLDSFYDDRIVEIIHGDTLTIDVDSDYLFYPFGKFKSVDDFLTAFPDSTSVLRKQVEQEHVTMLSLRYGNSTINALFAEIFRNVFTNFEIIDDYIVDSGIKTVNGIEIGMPKKLFFESFNFPYKSEFDETRVIETISTCKHIKCYYIFDENDILIEIGLCQIRF
ncbi:hypothetical protein LJC11_03015 [Bacteroidales bacterium OttesenSCG-928-I21]|nr:hypothetical protein [Bacteroidales bacterium OttesenSCG-928-I21]